MPIPASKTELIEAITTNYGKLKNELIIIPEKIALEKELEGHAKNTTMSIHNLVSYLVGWGQLVLKWHRKKEKGEQVDFPETTYKWNELGRLTQKFYKDYEEENYEDLLKMLDKTVKEILFLINNKTNEELYEQNWYDRYTLGRMIQLNTSSPYKNATIRIRKWRKEKGI